MGGGLAKALENALKFRRGKVWVQAEVRSQAELDQAIAGGAESIHLDHMTPAAVKKAVKQIQDALPGIPVEAGGGVTLANVADFAKAGVNFVVVDAVTSGAAWVDLTMKVALDVS